MNVKDDKDDGRGIKSKNIIDLSYFILGVGEFTKYKDMRLLCSLMKYYPH